MGVRRFCSETSKTDLPGKGSALFETCAPDSFIVKYRELLLAFPVPRSLLKCFAARHETEV